MKRGVFQVMIDNSKCHTPALFCMQQHEAGDDGNDGDDKNDDIDDENESFAAQRRAMKENALNSMKQQLKEDRSPAVASSKIPSPLQQQMQTDVVNNE